MSGTDPGGPLERDAPALPPESVTGATNTPNPPPSASETAQAARDEMAAFAHEATRIEISRLATIRELPSPYQAVEQAVDALFAAGFRRLVEDDDTIERLAVLFADWDEGRGPAARWTVEDLARVVVRALREEQA